MGQQIACCATGRERGNLHDAIHANTVSDDRFANISRDVGMSHLLAFAPLWPQDSKHDKRVAVASSCNVLVFEVVELDGLEFREEHAFSTSGITTIGFPDEATSDNLCLGYADGTIRIYSCVESFTLLHKLTHHKCEITVIASSQEHLIVGDAEGVISVTHKPDQRDVDGDGWCFVKKKMFNVWQKRIEAATGTIEESTVKHHHEKGKYRQARQYMRPLRRLLRTSCVSPKVLQHLADIARLSRERKHQQASSEYMRLAIGNAAWPVGVTGTSIHARPAESRISESSQVAHVLNDETSRKYLQMIKRLLTLAEELDS